MTNLRTLGLYFGLSAAACAGDARDLPGYAPGVAAVAAANNAPDGGKPATGRGTLALAALGLAAAFRLRRQRDALTNKLRTSEKLVESLQQELDLVGYVRSEMNVKEGVRTVVMHFPEQGNLMRRN